MAEQHLAAVQPRQDVFRPPVDAQHPAAAQTPGEAGRQREAQAFATLLDLGQHAPFQLRAQAADDGLDFGQLGHVCSDGSKKGGTE